MVMQSFTQIVSWVQAAQKFPTLYNSVLYPFAKFYRNLAGYRQLGLKMNDLIQEENDIVETAIKRLPPKVSYDRIYRLRTASQLALTHHVLPKSQQLTEEQDDFYLLPYILESEKEIFEKKALNNIEIAKV